MDWLVENYFDSACHDVAFTWSHMTLDFEESWGAANKDYVVANRLFTYFLDIQIPEECHYYENIVKRYPAGTQIMGWTDELKADKLFADYGYVMIPFISVVVVPLGAGHAHRAEGLRGRSQHDLCGDAGGRRRQPAAYDDL